jgi:sugar phosphate isomerase/epimerase
MQVGFVSLGMGAAPLDEVLHTATTVGAEALEVNGRATVHGNLWAPPIAYAQLKARIAACAVTPTSLGGYSNFAQPSDEALEAQVEQFVGYCQVAREMGIPIVRAFSGDALAGHTLDELYPRVVAGFKAVMARLSGWRLRVGIENHGRLMNDGDVLAALLHDVGSPALGITLDTGNFCWAGHSVDTAERFFAKLAPYTVNVHIKDGQFVNGAWVLTAAGRGALHLAELMHSLARAGYQGPILSEYEGEGEFATATLESVAYLRGLRDALGG